MNFKFTEENPFQLEMSGTFIFELTRTELIISFRIDSKEGDEDPDVKGGMTIPIDFFGHPPVRMQRIIDFLDTVRFNFKSLLRTALVQETTFHIDDVIHTAASDLGVEGHWSDKQILALHAQRTTERVTKMMAMDQRAQMVKRGKGQPSKWSKLKLIDAVSTALRAIPDGMAKDYENVNDILKRSYPEIAPASGESLRKLLSSFQINWRDLKAESNDE